MGGPERERPAARWALIRGHQPQRDSQPAHPATNELKFASVARVFILDLLVIGLVN